MNKFINNLGFGYRDDRYLAFFGNINCSAERLSENFPSLHFLKLQQTHSDIIVEATESVVTADSHFTSKKRYALQISTADCMPVLVYCGQTNRVAAIHAGWRGVVNQIVPKTLSQLTETGSHKREFTIFVGPSISQDSFAVDEDVFQLLQQSAKHFSTTDYYYPDQNKYYVDLHQIMRMQITPHLQNLQNLIFSDIDTKTDAQYNSYRRQKNSSGRNLSFICLE